MIARRGTDHGSGLGTKRWVVEQTTALLHWFATAGQQLLPAVADARVRPLIDSTVTFDTADKAAERLRSHQAHGKITLAVP
ncbi:hypothetical protein GCM10027072_46570 [Streptomyces bullii]